jgi:hypothetical protein
MFYYDFNVVYDNENNGIIRKNDKDANARFLIIIILNFC